MRKTMTILMTALQVVSVVLMFVGAESTLGVICFFGATTGVWCAQALNDK